jgi:Dehydrogenases with different specificities (related to short-chain alcohol dehydrogenases)
MVDRNKRYAGKTVLVTGAAGGLGRAYALGFAAEGGEVIVADINAQGLAETAAMVVDAGGIAETFTVDMGDEASILAFAQDVRARRDALDVLINNAGIAYGHISQNFAGVGQQQWLGYLAVNSVGPVLLADALRPQLAASPAGVVINQSSMSSYMPDTIYGVTKATLNAMTYGMAKAYGPDGIRVVAIAPGLMETPANRAGLSADLYSMVQGMQILKSEEGKAEDIVNLALFLASDEARFITCDVFSCDAGNSIRGWRN